MENYLSLFKGHPLFLKKILTLQLHVWWSLLYLNKLIQFLTVSDKGPFLHYHFSVTQDVFFCFSFNYETSHFLWEEKDQTQPMFQVFPWVFFFFPKYNFITKEGKPCGGSVQNSLIRGHAGQMQYLRDWLDFKSCSYAVECSNWYMEAIRSAAHAGVSVAVL